MKKFICLFCFLCGCMACTEENSFLENEPSTKPPLIVTPDTLALPPQNTDTVVVNNWNTVIGGVIILEDVK